MQQGPFFNIPKELTTEIASYLTTKELASFSFVCRHIREISEMDALWQPFLNRLKAIDSSISVNPSNDEIFSWRQSRFNESFLQINQRQMTEITHFQKYVKHIKLSDEDRKTLAKIHQPARKLRTLEKRDHFLNKLNADLIKKKIKINETTLYLNNLKLTRFPESLFEDKNYQEYWQKLKILNCGKNQLQTLPESLGNCHKLQLLYCSVNQLRTLPESLGNCQALKWLSCDHNQLQTLPASIGNCQALQDLRCVANKLRTLPESIGNCLLLRWLECNHNQLQELPESLGNCQALRWLDCRGNKLQTLPESLGNCQELSRLNCFSNKLRTLPKSLGNCPKLRDLHYDGNPLPQNILENILDVLMNKLRSSDSMHTVIFIGLFIGLGMLNNGVSKLSLAGAELTTAPSMQPGKTSLFIGALVGLSTLIWGAPLWSLALAGLVTVTTFTGLNNRKRFYQQSSESLQKLPSHLKDITIKNSPVYDNGRRAARGWMPYLQSQFSFENWKNSKTYAASYHEELINQKDKTAFCVKWRIR